MTLNADMIKFLKGSTIGEGAAPIRVAPTAPAILNLSPGTEVRAEILDLLANGRSLVRIAGELLSMELPTPLKSGDTLPLTFLTNQPRPTFMLSQQTVSGTPVELSSA